MVQIAVPGVGDEEWILLRGVLCCFIFTRVVGRLEGGALQLLHSQRPRELAWIAFPLTEFIQVGSLVLAG